MEGVRRGEPAVYVSLTETEKALRSAARSHGWLLEGIAIRELGSAASAEAGKEQYTLFHPTEIELAELTQRILAATAGMEAPRVVIDSLAEIRLLSGDPLRYRRQILGLSQAYSAQQATVLALDEGGGADGSGRQVDTAARGVIQLQVVWPALGDMRRSLRVLKMRGAPFRGGSHDLTIETGGVVVHPRLRVADHRVDFVREVASTGLPALDGIFGGGLDRGSASLLVGPTGSGKSVLATQLAVAAADRGEHVEMFIFDEIRDATLARAEGLKLDLREHVESGRVTLRQIDPGELAPWQFGSLVLKAAERDRARLIVIDSINGYLTAMPDERALDLALHELFGCLSQIGVIVVGTLLRHGIVGSSVRPSVDISYLSDTVALLSHFEVRGEVRSAIGIVKRRRGPHARTLHELHIGPVGLRIGAPLHEFEGLLTGNPRSLAAVGNDRQDDEPGDG